MRFLLALTMMVFAYVYSGEEQTWQKRHAEGWAWYHDVEKVDEETEEDLIQPTDPIIVLKIAKEELERALAKAVLDPSKENVFAYMVLQKEWVNKAKHFSKTWLKNILEHPEIGVKSPTTQYGIQVRKEVDALTRQKLIQDIAGKYILVFFYEGKSLFSQEFAKVVTIFSKKYRWITKPISVDGVVLKDFPKSLPDASFAADMKVSIFPSLFLVDMYTQQAVPISFGMTTISQIEENILTQFGE